jgi:RNA exonuclease 1
MIMIPEILLDTSIISLALFVWAVVIKLVTTTAVSAGNTANTNGGGTATPGPSAGTATAVGEDVGGEGARPLDTSNNEIDLEQNRPEMGFSEGDQIDDMAMTLQTEDVEVDELDRTVEGGSFDDLDGLEEDQLLVDIALAQDQIDDEDIEDLLDVELGEDASTGARDRSGTRSQRHHGLVESEDLVGEYDEEDGGYEDDEEPLVDSSQCGDSKDGTPLSSTPGSPKQSSGLSRRQKKNRKKIRKKQSQALTPLSRTSSEELKNESIVCIKKIVPCKQYVKLSQPDQEIYKMMIGYILSCNQMRQLGFPMQSSLYPGKAYVYRDPDLAGSEMTSVLLNATAEEFVPSSNLISGKKPLTAVNSSPTIMHSVDACASLSSVGPGLGEVPILEKRSATFTLGLALDSPCFTPRMFTPPATTTATSAATEDASLLSVYTRTHLTTANSSPSLYNQTRQSSSSVSVLAPSTSTTQSVPGFSINSITVKSSDLMERKCVRCTRSFFMHDSGQYYSQESCTYHWGKLRTDLQQYGDINQTYQCCGAQALKFSGQGCSTARLHVWSGFPLTGGIHGPLEGFIKTRAMKGATKEVRYTVFGLDCEMCYTTTGLELTKVTVVGIDGKLVYESLVKPENEIIDYNTRFSGITAGDLKGPGSKSLKEVQQDLNGFISADSVLIGHGLENDLRALKLIHDRVIDTSLVFPHFYGLPYRRSLRSLARSYLKREIQGNIWGHDSYEDARASIELMLWKVRKDVDKSSHDIIMHQTDHRHI